MVEISIRRIKRVWIMHEYPENSLSLTLQFGTGDQMVLYFDNLESWWRFRHAAPKHQDYFYSRRDEHAIDDHKKADAFAWAFYRRKRPAPLGLGSNGN